MPGVAADAGVRPANGARGQPRRDRRPGRAVVGGLVVAGLAIGVSIAWLLSRTVEAFLFQIEPGDARVFAAAVGVLALTGLAAAIVPARRASGIDPLVALRE
jgi:ABC-type antimicrobial peptide transport system permease subunit